MSNSNKITTFSKKIEKRKYDESVCPLGLLTLEIKIPMLSVYYVRRVYPVAL